MSENRKTYQILVIEDNPGDFVLIEEHFKENRVQIDLDHAKTYREAESLLIRETGRYDAVLLDLTLPDRCGNDLIEEVLNLSYPSPLIVLTGHSDLEFSIKSLSIGVSDYLIKDELTASNLWKSILYSIERKLASKRLEDSEKRYKKLFENNPSPMLIWDIETRKIVDCNVEALIIYGYTKKDLLNLAIDDLREEEDNRQEMEQEYSQVYPKAVRAHKNKSGSLIYMEENGHTLEYKRRNCILMLLNDVSEKINLQEQIIEHSIQAEEQERNRIANELHDGIIQQLVISGMFTQNLLDLKGDPDLLDQKITKLYNLLNKITSDTRNLSHKLKSAEVETMSLSEMVGQLVSQLTNSSDIHFTLNNYLPKNCIIDMQAKINIYRSLQELCNNIVKHSGATEAVITMEKVENDFFLSITDNGRGFEMNGTKTEGIGVANVKNRVKKIGGIIQFNVKNNGGLHVNIEVPNL